MIDTAPVSQMKASQLFVFLIVYIDHLQATQETTTARRYASVVCATAPCPSVCVCVCVCHKSELYQNAE